MKLDKYVDKLYNVWVEHKNIIIAVDFDDTLCPWNTASKEFCRELIDLLIECKQFGAKLMLYTCRDGHSLEEAIDYCEQHNLTFNRVNPSGTQFGLSCKPFYNILLDDKAGLEQAFTVLCLALQKYKLYQYETNEKQWSQSELFGQDS